MQLDIFKAKTLFTKWENKVFGMKPYLFSLIEFEVFSFNYYSFSLAQTQNSITQYSDNQFCSLNLSSKSQVLPLPTWSTLSFPSMLFPHLEYPFIDLSSCKLKGQLLQSFLIPASFSVEISLLADFCFTINLSHEFLYTLFGFCGNVVACDCFC